MDQNMIASYVNQQNCEWIFNPPHSSHFGGVWERQILTIRQILDGMFADLGPRQLTHELLTTLMAVVGIMNSRPIATIPSDAEQPQPLSPNMLLTMKSRPLTSPPGLFTSHDLYSRHHWRRVQYLADQFWTRWKREYLQNLQSRAKWNQQRRNLEVGNIVMIKDNTHRNKWPLGRVSEAIKSQDGKANEVGSSNAMELKGAKTSFKFLQDSGLQMHIFISDQHKGIAKWIRTKHFNDIWHANKSINKQLRKAR
ncbi:uncharacterized protein LOC114535469 [Dendronephthya gigantea]|uniref:uncharacterized protein LOC114535469 n=1 Tax=Dendronephthya gigantea TaxID=151771 RepID=UPI00106C6F31|nr:uncharacterized protein LOC114535469 [Dendronephthya gigantea]